MINLPISELLYETVHRISKNDPAHNCYQILLDTKDNKGAGKLLINNSRIIFQWDCFEEGLAKAEAYLEELLQGKKENFLKKLREGGAIVSSNQCSTLEIDDARASNRFFVDEDGYGYVWRTHDWLTSRENAFLKIANQRCLPTAEEMDLKEITGE